MQAKYSFSEFFWGCPGENLWHPLSGGVYSGARIVVSKMCASSIFLDNVTLFFKLSTPVRTTEFLISEYSPKHCGLPVFHFCRASGFKRTFHCGFNLHFPDLMRLSIFSYVYWHLCYYYLFLNFANLIYKKWCLIYISLITKLCIRFNTFSYAY